MQRLKKKTLNDKELIRNKRRGTGSSFFLPALFIALSVLLSGIMRLEAHIIEQLYGTLKQQEPIEIEILFDVGYAIEETRNKPEVPQPTREWLQHCSVQEWDELKQKTEQALRSYLFLEHPSGQRLNWHLTFSDFRQTPPSFPQLLNQGAYFTVIISLVEEIEDPSNIRIRLAASQGENLVPDLVLFAPHKESLNSKITASSSLSEEENDTENDHYLLIKSGESQALFTKVDTSQFARFFLMGFAHVIPMGWDHILFIVALVLLSSHWKSLLWQSLAFTVTHSISLALMVSDRLPAMNLNWVEPLIALSIAFVAIENLYSSQFSKKRLWTVSIFGFIHGLGFGGSLGGLLKSVSAQGEWILPLIEANIGVEVAQITIILSLLLLERIWMSFGTRFGTRFGKRNAFPHYKASLNKGKRLLSLIIAVIGFALFIDRCL